MEFMCAFMRVHARFEASGCPRGRPLNGTSRINGPRMYVAGQCIVVPALAPCIEVSQFSECAVWVQVERTASY